MRLAIAVRLIWLRGSFLVEGTRMRNKDVVWRRRGRKKSRDRTIVGWGGRLAGTGVLRCGRRCSTLSSSLLALVES